MFKNYRIGAILLMAGSGNRMGSEIPKQFLLLGNKKVYLHTLETFDKIGIFDEIILVTHPEWLEIVAQEITVGKIVTGATTRQQSTYQGLSSFSQKPDIVLVHDAVRPFVSQKILLDNVEQAMIYGAVDTCIPSTDTLVYAPEISWIDHIPQRADYQRGQTPQTFRYEWLVEAHQKAVTKNASDDCALVLQQGKSVHIVQGDDRNFKITTKFDIIVAEILLNNNYLTK